MKNLIELKSVGSHFDKEEEMIYPTNSNGTPDLENGTPLLQVDCEFLGSLDVHDLSSLVGALLENRVGGCIIPEINETTITRKFGYTYQD